MSEKIKIMLICLYWDIKMTLGEFGGYIWQNPFIFPALSVMKFFGVDKWYAQKILGWELEYDSFSINKSYHFHKKNGSVVRPSDY